MDIPNDESLPVGRQGLRRNEDEPGIYSLYEKCIMLKALMSHILRLL